MHLAGVPPKLFDAPLFLLHEFEGLFHTANDGRRKGSCENQTPGAVLQILDHLAISSDEAAHGTKRFREGAHGDVHLVLHTEMIHRATTLAAKHAERVGFVHIDKGAVALRHGDDFRQVGDVARHAEDTIENDQSTGFFRKALETVFERCGGVVPKWNQLRRRKLATIDDARMVLAVAEDGVSIFCERNQSTLVGKKTGGEKNGVLAAKKIGNGLLQLHMEFDGAIQETRTGAASPVASRRVAGGLNHARILSKTEVIVRPDHDFPLTVTDHVIAMRLLD